MNSNIIFIKSVLSNYLVASKKIEDYAKSLIRMKGIKTNNKIVIIKSTLIGVDNILISKLIEYDHSVIGFVDKTPCIIVLTKANAKSYSQDFSSIFDIVSLEHKNYLKFDLNELSPFSKLNLINSVIEVVLFEQDIQDNLRQVVINKGVYLQNPSSVYLSDDTEFGNNVTIEQNVKFGSNVKIGDNVTIKSFSYIEGANIGSDVQIGPFARIRGASIIGNNTKIGNFVEVKNSSIDSGSKMGHLAYIGDSQIGKNVTIGAGVVTCNYNGKNKFKTKIGSNSFIGSNSSIIAPIDIGNNVFIGASSFINKDVADSNFAYGCRTQKTKPNKLD